MAEEKPREAPRVSDSGSSLRRTLFQTELQAKSRTQSPAPSQSIGRETVIRNIQENESPVSTPRKSREKENRASFVTPRRKGSHPADVDPYVSPAAIKQLLTPNAHAKTTPVAPSPVPLHDMLGPTPNRDGKPLGLFDLLSSSTKSPNTPAKRRLADIDEALLTPTTKSLKPDAISTLTTPMKDTRIADQGIYSTPRPPHKHSPSPVSSSKRFYLANFFATPSTRRQLAAESHDPNEEPLGSLGMTPSRPGDSGTPSFLRRRNLASNPRPADAGQDGQQRQDAHATGDDNTDAARSPTKVRRSPNKKLFGKRLSMLVKELRDMEDQKHDDDLDLLRDLEDGNEQEAGGDAANNDPTQEDGGDDEAGPEQPSPPPQQARKKKGAKRTTRRVNIKPVRAKPKKREATPEWEVYDEEGEQEKQENHGSANEDELASVAITVPKGRAPKSKSAPKSQSAATAAVAASADARDGGAAPSASEYEDIPDDDDDDDDGDGNNEANGDGGGGGAPKTSKAKSTARGTKKGKSAKQAKQPRKINAEAHANYRSLKIQRKKPPNRRQGRY